MGKVFDLEDKPGVWFDLEGGGRVQLCVLTRQDIRKIRKQTTKKCEAFKLIEGVAKRFEWEEIDHELYSELTLDRCLVSWDGFSIKVTKDGKSELIECTPENCNREMKNLLTQNCEEFAAFILKSIVQLADMNAAKEEATEKNS